jgi:hypothetical protein
VTGWATLQPASVIATATVEPDASVAMMTVAGHGLGLFLVDQLARRWGCDLEPSEKVVWFEL